MLSTRNVGSKLENRHFNSVMEKKYVSVKTVLILPAELNGKLCCVYCEIQTNSDSAQPLHCQREISREVEYNRNKERVTSVHSYFSSRKCVFNFATCCHVQWNCMSKNVATCILLFSTYLHLKRGTSDRTGTCWTGCGEKGYFKILRN